MADVSKIFNPLFLKYLDSIDVGLDEFIEKINTPAPDEEGGTHLNSDDPTKAANNPFLTEDIDYSGMGGYHE